MKVHSFESNRVQNLSLIDFSNQTCLCQITLISSVCEKQCEKIAHIHVLRVFGITFQSRRKVWKLEGGGERYFFKLLQLSQINFDKMSIMDRQKDHQKILVIKTNTCDDITKILRFGILIHVLSWKQKKHKCLVWLLRFFDVIIDSP